MPVALLLEKRIGDVNTAPSLVSHSLQFSNRNLSEHFGLPRSNFYAELSLSRPLRAVLCGRRWPREEETGDEAFLLTKLTQIRRQCGGCDRLWLTAGVADRTGAGGDQIQARN
jgi:hypothetical protein